MYISIWLLCCTPSKLNATIDLKRFILLSEEKQPLSSLVHWSWKTQRKNCSQRHTFEDQSRQYCVFEGVSACVCMYVWWWKEKERSYCGLQPLATIPRHFINPLVESWLNWLMLSCGKSAVDLTDLQTAHRLSTYAHTELIETMHACESILARAHTHERSNT